MSLTTNFVLADDGKFYEDPLIVGGKYTQWFLCFDDEDPPEFVLRVQGVFLTSELEAIARGILRDWGIAADIVAIRRGSRRLFDGKFRPAAAFDLHITKPIPAHLMGTQKGHKFPGYGTVWLCGGQRPKMKRGET